MKGAERLRMRRKRMGREVLGELGGGGARACTRAVGARVARADVERAELEGHLDAELGGALAQVHVEVGAHLPVGVQEQPLRLR